MKYLKGILGKLAGMSRVQLALAVSAAVVSIGTVSMAGYVTYG